MALVQTKDLPRRGWSMLASCAVPVAAIRPLLLALATIAHVLLREFLFISNHICDLLW